MPRSPSSSKPTLIDELDKSRFVAARAPKWGSEAASYMWKRQQDRRLLAVLASLVFLLAVLANIRQPLTWVLLCIGVTIAIVVAARAMSYGRKVYQSASEALGVTVDRHRGNSPSDDSQVYEEWCAKKGLTPYSAAKHLERGRQAGNSANGTPPVS
jgi:hypothetical protein